jgi:glycosyltransferase involved in cell wall biosynthesis
MLSIIIPARNEIYLQKTIENILANAEGEIEILVMLDGYLPDPPIDTKDKRVVFVHYKDNIGQRKCINAGVRLAVGKYIMKLDAHCAVDKGFDVKLAAECEPDWTVIPRMYNLDINTFTPKLHKRTDYMYISAPVGEKPFRASYFSGNDYYVQHRKEALIDDTMCCMGPGWFMHKQRFLDQGGCDEGHEGGWGQQGVEVSLKAWLSGGALKVNKKTWFSHWFRGDQGFPYPIGGNQIERARVYSRDLWLNDKWDKATRKLSWLVEKFNPPGWTKEVPAIKILSSPSFSMDSADMVSIIIPSREERFLNNTIRDVLSNATGDIEIFPVLDGYEPEELVVDPRVKYIRIPNNGRMQKRQGINTAVSISNGKYVMALDAHCMVGKGFDEILKKDCEENWIVIPRRYKLNPIEWKPYTDDGIPIDYEYWMYRSYADGILKPYHWGQRAIERKDIMIDDTLTCQGSCWFMHKSYFKKMGFMDTNGYTGWGQEDVELAMRAWTDSGRMVVNKNTWYAHLFKGKTYGRYYKMNQNQHAESRRFAFDYWCVKRKDEFMKVLKKFAPIPNWNL